jgi:RecA/RadA recombinase
MAKKTPSALLEKIRGNSTIDATATLSESKVFTDKDMIPTQIPMLNVAWSGTLTGGFTPGVTALAGPSKHFKSGFALTFIKAYFDKYPESVGLFYDSEFGTPKNYWKTFGIDMNRIVHTPVTDIEELKHDIVQQLHNLERDDRIIIVIDSIGNLASRKEVEDALEGSSKADMTRAKQLKSLFRMVTPHLTLKNIPMFIVNHTYKEQSLFPRDIMSGGTGPMYSSNTVWILGRQQEKEDGKVSGYNFVINVEKSRFVREKSKILISVDFEKGISPWSGLLDVAQETGHIKRTKQKPETYATVNGSTGEMGPETKRDDTDTLEFWKSVLQDKTFHQAIERKYKLETPSPLMIGEEEVD